MCIIMNYYVYNCYISVPNYYDYYYYYYYDSILNFIAKSLQPVINVQSSLYADVNGFLNPSIITGENYRPDLLFLIQSKCLYVLELTVGFESNLNNNAVRKKEKYVNLINEMSRNYRCVRFVNLSMSSLGVFSNECSTFLDMMNDIGIDKKHQRYVIKKVINIAIRATYYIFCCRNRNWDSPDLMQFWFIVNFFFFYFVLFCFCCLLFIIIIIFNNSISSSICKLPIRSEIYNCTFKTQIKFPLLLLYNQESDKYSH